MNLNNYSVIIKERLRRNNQKKDLKKKNPSIHIAKCLNLLLFHFNRTVINIYNQWHHKRHPFILILFHQGPLMKYIITDIYQTHKTYLCVGLRDVTIKNKSWAGPCDVLLRYCHVAIQGLFCFMLTAPVGWSNQVHQGLQGAPHW